MLTQQKLGMGLMLISLVIALTSPARVDAQAQPPDRFFGSAQVDGKDQPDGTVVEAYIGNTLCGSGTVQERNGSTIYLVDVLSATQKPGCAKDGDTVKFKIAGLDAKETAKYATAEATHLDLTASGTPKNPALPTVLAPGQGGTPATPLATPAPTPVATETETPAPVATPPPTETATATAAASETPAASATPTGTPGATATNTATASATATVTPTPSVTATPLVVTSTPQPQSHSAGNAGKVLILALIALVVIGAAVAIWVYYQGRARTQA